MPYSKLDELPPAVKKYLPEAAQHIFMAAFNASFAKNHDMDPKDRDKMCFRVAWGAVKKSYKKGKNGLWVKKPGRKKKTE